MQAMSTNDTDDVRSQGWKAAEGIVGAVERLRAEVAEEGPMAAAFDELLQACKEIRRAQNDDSQFASALAATHRALAHTLSVGRSIRQLLSRGGLQAFEDLADAQQIIYPLAKRFSPEEPASQQTPAGSERRTSPRVGLQAEISFVSEDNFYTGFSEDLSDGGLFVTTYDLRPIGTMVDLDFTLPDGHTIQVKAEVRWLRDLRQDSDGVSSGMGLSFHQLAPQDLAAIKSFLKARSPIFYDD